MATPWFSVQYILYSGGHPLVLSTIYFIFQGPPPDSQYNIIYWVWPPPGSQYNIFYILGATSWFSVQYIIIRVATPWFSVQYNILSVATPWFSVQYILHSRGHPLILSTIYYIIHQPPPDSQINIIYCIKWLGPGYQAWYFIVACVAYVLVLRTNIFW